MRLYKKVSKSHETFKVQDFVNTRPDPSLFARIACIALQSTENAEGK